MKYMILIIRSCSLCVLICPGLPLAAEEWAAERLQFQEALRAWDQGRMQTFQRHAGMLRDYPLYPYLRYRQMNRGSRNYAEVRDFIATYPDFPANARLRASWLPRLAARGHWQQLLDIHDPATRSEQQRCLALQAKLQLGHAGTLVSTQAVPLFLIGKSRHSACDPVFAFLYSTPQADELIWQRIGLALQAGQPALARYLHRKLDGEWRQLAERLLHAHQAPQQALRSPRTADQAEQRTLLAHAVRRLADAGRIDLALRHWRGLLDRYAYSPEEQGETARHLARRARHRRHPATLELLDQAGPLDKQLFTRRLQAALENRLWQQLADWTRTGPGAGTDVDALQWRYWRARALEQLGHSTEAQQHYRELARERDYYGFLAADRMGLEYQLNHVPTVVDPGLQQRLLAQPAMQRAREWFLLGEPRKARLEWNQALRDMDSEALQTAAWLTTSWGWHDRAIFALGRAAAYDDLELRFPLIYGSLLEEHAGRNGLDTSWIYATVRAESAFMTDARSPAGALGLMQLLPAVGRSTARSLRLRNYATRKLLDAETNIQLGSHYLHGLYETFNGNLILATGAYNAGPHRIRKWLRRRDCAVADIWIEMIPFQETRVHIRRVLLYATIYDWLLQRRLTPLSERMASSNGAAPLCDAASS